MARGEVSRRRCLVHRLGGGLQTERREGHTPPVLPLPLADDDTQGGILPGREGEAVILLGGEPAPLQAGGHRLAPPRLCHRRMTRRGQLLQVGLQGGPGLLQSGALGVKGLRLGQHPVPHLKLQRLVLRAVRVGDHMKADHPVGQLGLLPVQPEAAQQSTQQPEHQSQLPALQIPIQHKNTVHPM